MKTRLALVFLASGTLVFATGTAFPRQHITRLEMGFDVDNGIIAPAAASRVRVPPGETVILIVPSDSAAAMMSWEISAIQWLKDGKPIAGTTDRMLSIASAGSGDSGLYTIGGLPEHMVATGIQLDVVAEGHMANLSSRVELAAKQPQIVGFVVNGRAPKNCLFRAVGPTLENFGLPHPAPRPRVRCFAADGHEISFAHPAVVIDVNALFTSIGAFPVTAEELPTISFDYGVFPPGAYTVQVTDDTGGTAIVEVYELPPDAVLRPAP